ncbi:MAG TPA: response regulator [Acidobacteriaceae bacterium]|nr:response regulator [Acidobacteriaceae bacterium]
MKTVLVAEDNPVNRELIAEMLEAEGYRVIEANDGQDALMLLNFHHPDVVLLDIQMPRLDGRETVRAIRENPDLASLRVIACTAYAMQGDREDILRCGFDGYVAKPISRAELLEAVAAD